MFFIRYLYLGILSINDIIMTPYIYEWDCQIRGNHDNRSVVMDFITNPGMQDPSTKIIMGPNGIQDPLMNLTMGSDEIINIMLHFHDRFHPGILQWDP